MSHLRPTAHPHPATSWISTLARWLLGGVLIAAGSMKVVDLSTSVGAVRAYQLLPDPVAVAVGWGLPFFSIVLGLVLLAGAFTRVAAVIAALLNIVFLIAIASAAARGLSVDCGCFGGGGEVAPGQEQYGIEALSAAGLLLTAGWLIWRPRSRFSFDRPVVEEELERAEERDMSSVR